MNWLNIYTPSLRSPEFIGSEPTARATWLYVFAYCAEQENGGRIVGARAWKDRQWQQTCGVTLAEVEASAPLVVWDGNDLVLHAYPNEKESEIQAKREGGRRGGKASGEARKKAMLEASCEAQLPSSASSIASSSPRTEGEGEGEGEEKRKEKRKGTTQDPSLAAAPSASLMGFDEFWNAYPKKKAKGSAEKAWLKIRDRRTLLPAILDAIDKAKRCHDWQKDGGQFIPHPATWLNRRGWEDEVATGHRPTNGRPAGFENWKSPPMPGDDPNPPWGTQAYIRKNGHGI